MNTVKPFANAGSLAQAFWRDGQAPDCPVYDMHGHMGEHGAITFPCADTAAMLRHLERINGKLLFCHHWALYSPEFDNASCVEIVRRHPDRLRAYMAVNPTHPDLLRRDLELYDSWKPWMVGFKLLADFHKVKLSDPAYAPALERANAEKAMVLLHTWGGSPYDGAEEVRKVVARYPDIIYLLGHAFNNRWDEAMQIVRDFPENVYLELTSIPGTAGVVEKFVNAIGSERLLFGTDLPWFDEYQAVGGIIGARIGDDAMRDILYRNAQKLLPDF